VFRCTRGRFRASLLGLVVLCSAAASTAQSFYGGVRGGVRDAAGVVPAVELTLVNEETAVARTSVTNSAGEYAFTDVAPGRYTLRAILSGYKTFERRGLIISTQEFLTLDITLEVGTVREEVTVTGATPIVQRANASTGQVLDKKALDTLPNHGRSAFVAATTLPTIVSHGDPKFDRQQDQNNTSFISLGGGQMRTNNFLFDGVPITTLTGAPSAIPTLEALAEVKVQVHTYDAEMGRTGGGVLNATARSGTNTTHGSSFVQTRPVWAQANDFFAERAGLSKPTDLYFRSYGGSLGGPIVRNRTFFWSATEGYRSENTQTGQLYLPTVRERAGDFSRTLSADGNLIVIYDPSTTQRRPDGAVTRDPFPGNVIPSNRLSAVARRILGYFPLPDVDQSAIGSGEPNYARTAPVVDRGDMVTTKIEHKVNERTSLTGTYLFNNTNEPAPIFWGAGNAADPNQGVLHRRIHIVALNNTFIVDPTTVATFRYGWTRYDDNFDPLGRFDLAGLGFPASFVNDVTYQAFPEGCIEGSECFGPTPPIDTRWSSWGFSGTLSKLVGSHTVKIGGDFRRVAMDNFSFGDASGLFAFDREWTEADPFRPSETQGSGLASFLLGLPSADPGNISEATVTRPLQVFVKSYSGYVQDDARLRSNMTLNLGLRYEYEAGLKEQQNRFTVAFDRDAVSPLAALTGLPLRGGLRYAGTDGAPDYQGDPSRLKLSPRIGVALALGRATVLRGGYGLFWSPWNYGYPDSVNYGQIGYSQQTAMAFTNQLLPNARLDDPFPNGLRQPAGSSLGLLTGVGGEINYVSQNRRSPRIHQYSADLQRELRGHMAVSIGYTGTWGDDLNYGGGTPGNVRININQLPLAALTLGPALYDDVPNPFFGIPEAGDLSRSATIERRQLLRPFPQFGNIFERQTSGARLRYNAVSAMIERRVASGWGGRFHYTWSRRDDDQFGDSSTFSFRESSQPQNSYDLGAEYSRSIQDVPHRVVLAPILELPVGEGRRWMTHGIADILLGGWTVAATARYESGLPRAIVQVTDNSGSFSGLQRPNLTGADPRTSGSTEDRLDHYINPAAYAFAAPFTFGNAPRTDPRIRSPFRTNYDVALSKDTRTVRRVNTQLRVELLNLTNSPVFFGGNGVFGSRAFGTITRQAGFPRLLQVTARASW
jgi:trimeric autotransporter adhesin